MGVVLYDKENQPVEVEASDYSACIEMGWSTKPRKRGKQKKHKEEARTCRPKNFKKPLRIRIDRLGEFGIRSQARERGHAAWNELSAETLRQWLYDTNHRFSR